MHRRVLRLAAGLAAVTVATQKPLGMLACTVVDGGPEVRELTSGHFAIRVWAAPAALMNHARVAVRHATHAGRLALGVLTGRRLGVPSLGGDLAVDLGAELPIRLRARPSCR